MIRPKLSSMEICWVTYTYVSDISKKKTEECIIILIKLCQPLHGGSDQDILARTYVHCQLGLVLVLLAL